MNEIPKLSVPKLLWLVLLIAVCGFGAGCGGGGGSSSSTSSSNVSGSQPVRSGGTSTLNQSDNPGNQTVGRGLYAGLTLVEAPNICAGLVIAQGATYTIPPTAITPFGGDTGSASSPGPSFTDVVDNSRVFTPTLTIYAKNDGGQFIPLYKTTYTAATLPHLQGTTYDLSFFRQTDSSVYPQSTNLLSSVVAPNGDPSYNFFSTVTQQPLLVGPITITESNSTTTTLPATYFSVGSFTTLSPAVGTSGVAISPVPTAGGTLGNQWSFTTSGLATTNYSCNLGLSLNVGSQTLASGSVAIQLTQNAQGGSGTIN